MGKLRRKKTKKKAADSSVPEQCLYLTKEKKAADLSVPEQCLYLTKEKKAADSSVPEQCLYLTKKEKKVADSSVPEQCLYLTKMEKKTADSSVPEQCLYLTKKAAHSSVPEQCLYLFSYIPRSGYVLYKIDINTTTPADPYLSPILEIPMGEKPVKGMRCGQIGSKFYFLGGSVVPYGDHKTDPLDVYVFDVLTNDLKKMDPPLNAGKSSPCVVFTCNGKLYALGRIPDVPPEKLPFMDLFECYDPATGKWELLPNLPPVEMGIDGFSRRRIIPQRIDWIKSIVLEERQQVVLYGVEYKRSNRHHVKFIYDLRKDEWTREVFQERGKFCFECADDHFYGLPSGGPPIKSKSSFINWFDRIDLFGSIPVADVAFISVDGKHVLDNGNWADWMVNTFPDPYVAGSFMLLRHLGSRHFCYVVSGIVGEPNTRYRGDTIPRDLTTRGITIVLFKEVEGKQAAGEEVCFEAEILGSKEYFISTTNPRNVDVYNMMLMDDLLVA